MANKLADQNSPYLLQHAENPVHWYPWGEEALERAGNEDKPIFLSIGYAACHWCHVMAHESFEDPATAALMNEHFVNIKVDREDRPDLDNIYMQAVVTMTGHGGWPMSVFLTPDGRPFYGGTYFPPEPRYNMPSFRDLLNSIATLWAEDRERLLSNADVLTSHLQEVLQDTRAGEPLSPEILADCVETLSQSYQWKTGGWGSPPKFPHPMTIEFALRQAARGDKMALDMAVHALEAMAAGGMYDNIGGGFARYSVDERWHIPHFEKMLYDNALLARAYLHAFLLTENDLFRIICEQTLDFTLRELTHPMGGFYSSLDADSEGVEGKFYTWTQQELEAVIKDPVDLEIFTAAHAITHEGNIEGRNCLQRVLSDEELAKRYDLKPARIADRMNEMRDLLFKERSSRKRPDTDDKVLASWNGLMLIAFAEAGRYLKRKDYSEAAQRNASFLINEMLVEKRLHRSWRNGRAQHNAYLEDYSSLILGLLALYQTSPDPHLYQTALALNEEMLANYIDPAGGFFDTHVEQKGLLLRPKDTQDNATPSGSSLAAEALLQLSILEGKSEWREVSETMIAGMIPDIKRFPTAFSHWLCAADFAIGPIQEVAVIGAPEDQETTALVHTLWEEFRPRLLAAFSDGTDSHSGPALLQDRDPIEGKSTAYVCEQFVCKQPVNTPAELASLLNEALIE